jgi:hypothetical protein
MKSRRPNAGGGRHNQSKPQCAARARFSNWKPPSKNLKEKFKKQREVKEAPVKNNRPSYFNDALQKVIVPVPEKIAENKIYGTISFAPEVAQRFMDACQLEFSHGGGIDVHVPKKLEKNDDKQENLFVDDYVKEIVNKEASVYVSKQNIIINQTPRESDIKLLKYFQQFSINDDILISLLNYIPSTFYPTCDELLFLLSLRLTSWNSTVDTSIVMTQLLEPQKLKINRVIAFTINDNSDLLSEIEALNSIYCEDGNQIEVKVTDMFQSNVPIVQLDIHLTLRDINNLPPFYIHFRLFIYKADIYPNRGSLLLGWILSSPPPIPKNSSHSIDTDQYREVCIHAMQDIHKHHFNFESPVVYDFIEYVRSNLLTDYSSISAPPLTCSSISLPASSSSKQAHIDTKAIKSNKSNINDLSTSSPLINNNSVSSAVKVDSSLDEKVIATVQRCADIPLPLSRPTTRHKECSEYRNALLEAINSGLKGKEAKAKVNIFIACALDLFKSCIRRSAWLIHCCHRYVPLSNIYCSILTCL